MDDEALIPDDSTFEKMKRYAQTPKGLILLAETVISLIVIICFAASDAGGHTTLGICEMIFAAIFFWIYMTELDKTFRTVYLLGADFFRAAVGTLMYLVFSLIVLFSASHHRSMIAAGVFGLIAGVLFSYDTYVTYLKIMSSKQGSGAAAA